MNAAGVVRLAFMMPTQLGDDYGPWTERKKHYPIVRYYVRWLSRRAFAPCFSAEDHWKQSMPSEGRGNPRKAAHHELHER
jgi:hypothetical protein